MIFFLKKDNKDTIFLFTIYTRPIVGSPNLWRNSFTPSDAPFFI